LLQAKGKNLEIVAGKGEEENPKPGTLILKRIVTLERIVSMTQSLNPKPETSFVGRHRQVLRV
jgi:hypothetical protein